MDFEVFNFIYNIHLTARVSGSLMNTEMFYWIFTANMLLVYKKSINFFSVSVFNYILYIYFAEI